MVAEECATLIDGNGVPPNMDTWVVRDVRKFQRVVDPPDGTHGVPHPHKPKRTFGARHHAFEVTGEVEVFLDRVFRVVAVLSRALDAHPHSDDVGYERFISRLG